ncbi:ABC-three component system middle component 2 [Enterovibrio norvegicus]|uniref:ABC-three component system middle component 2 n=1 Tax=Enterovibrio norvegicus TaxID=188144 RepID=UPI000371A5F2|nr:ABC-three component system middle component 2 [Enterovibrio norvegicus]OEF57940.1 hypothetical protein A1OU_06965 [Enterovibrio norvegicus]
MENKVFNTSLESGVRVVSFLDKYYPDRLDFEQIMKIDYIMVNSSDFNGPNSLHPRTPNRQGERSARREIVRSGLELMTSFRLIEIELNSNGVFYKSTESAEPYLKLMKEKYSLELIKVSHWLADKIRNEGFSQLEVGLNSKVI